MIVPPDATRPIVDENGKMFNAFSIFTLLLSRLDILTGSGNPEGVVEAEQKRLYMDEAGSAGAILYIKRDSDIAGDTTKGWISV